MVHRRKKPQRLGERHESSWLRWKGTRLGEVGIRVVEGAASGGARYDGLVKGGK